MNKATSQDNILEIQTSKFMAAIDVLIYEVFAIFGIFIIYIMIKAFGEMSFDQFNTQFLYSLLIIPITQNLRTLLGKVLYPFSIKAQIDKDSNRIKVKSGIYKRFMDDMKIKNIENIEKDYTPIGRLFGFKNIVIRNYGSHIQIPYVKNYNEVVTYVKSNSDL